MAKREDLGGFLGEASSQLMTHLAAGMFPSWVLEMNPWALSVGLHRPMPLF
jgi:hypothetical protein